MNELSRRTLLKCLAALPAARALAAFTPSPSWANSARQGAAQSITQLNVLFHGLIGFFVENGKIYGMPADVPGHVFQAGNQNSLMTLAKGVKYTLSGVRGQRNLPDFDERRNPVVRGAFKRDAQSAYCTLELPYPDKVVPQRRIPITKGPFFTGSHAPQNLQELPSVLVYVYTHFDSEKLRLGPLSWVPEVHDGVGTLHVYAEPRCPAPDRHVALAFPHLLPPLGSPNLQLNSEYYIRAPLKDPDPAIDGVFRDDLKNLDEVNVCPTVNPDNCTPITVIAQ